MVWKNRRVGIIFSSPGLQIQSQKPPTVPVYAQLVINLSLGHSEAWWSTLPNLPTDTGYRSLAIPLLSKLCHQTTNMLTFAQFTAFSLKDTISCLQSDSKGLTSIFLPLPSLGQVYILLSLLKQFLISTPCY